jgi:hypothetical protein
VRALDPSPPVRSVESPGQEPRVDQRVQEALAARIAEGPEAAGLLERQSKSRRMGISPKNDIEVFTLANSHENIVMKTAP